MDEKTLNLLKQKSSIDVVVRPNQKNNSLYIVGNRLILEIKAKPENNKANDELEKYLSKLFEKNAKIIKGKTSNKKTIKLTQKNTSKTN